MMGHKKPDTKEYIYDSIYLWIKTKLTDDEKESYKANFWEVRLSTRKERKGDFLYLHGYVYTITIGILLHINVKNNKKPLMGSIKKENRTTMNLFVTQSFLC